MLIMIIFIILTIRTKMPTNDNNVINNTNDNNAKGDGNQLPLHYAIAGTLRCLVPADTRHDRRPPALQTQSVPGGFFSHLAAGNDFTHLVVDAASGPSDSVTPVSGHPMMVFRDTRMAKSAWIG